MSGRPFIGLEDERGGRATEGNGRRRWCSIMVVEATVSGGDRPRRWGVTRRCSGRFRSGRGSVRRRGTCAHEATVAAARPGEDDDRRGPRDGKRGWGGLVRPKVKDKWQVAMAAQWEGKGEWADRGGRRGRPRLGQN
jgi:hypothetical protein